MRRRLPGVDTVLQNPSLAAATELYGRDLITVQIRAELESLRGRLVEEAFEEDSFTVAVEDLPQRVVASLQQMYGAPLRRVINATGIFLHSWTPTVISSIGWRAVSGATAMFVSIDCYKPRRERKVAFW
jgi:hypothetical protein